MRVVIKHGKLVQHLRRSVQRGLPHDTLDGWTMGPSVRISALGRELADGPRFQIGPLSYRHSWNAAGGHSFPIYAEARERTIGQQP